MRSFDAAEGEVNPREYVGKALTDGLRNFIYVLLKEDTSDMGIEKFCGKVEEGGRKDGGVYTYPPRGKDRLE